METASNKENPFRDAWNNLKQSLWIERTPEQRLTDLLNVPLWGLTVAFFAFKIVVPLVRFAFPPSVGFEGFEAAGEGALAVFGSLWLMNAVTKVEWVVCRWIAHDNKPLLRLVGGGQ